jgi:glucose repression mediator protein
MAELPKIEVPKFDVKRDWPILFGALAAILGLVWWMRSSTTVIGAQPVSTGGGPGSGSGSTGTASSSTDYAAALAAQTQQAQISGAVETSRYNALSNTIGSLAQAISQMNIAGISAGAQEASAQAQLQATQAQISGAEDVAGIQGQTQVSETQIAAQRDVTQTALNTTAAIKASANNTAAQIQQAQFQAQAQSNAANAQVQQAQAQGQSQVLSAAIPAAVSLISHLF